MFEKDIVNKKSSHKLIQLLTQKHFIILFNYVTFLYLIKKVNLS